MSASEGLALDPADEVLEFSRGAVQRVVTVTAGDGVESGVLSFRAVSGAVLVDAAAQVLPAVTLHARVKDGGLLK